MPRSFCIIICDNPLRLYIRVQILDILVVMSFTKHNTTPRRRREKSIVEMARLVHDVPHAFCTTFLRPRRRVLFACCSNCLPLGAEFEQICLNKE